MHGFQRKHVYYEPTGQPSDLISESSFANRLDAIDAICSGGKSFGERASGHKEVDKRVTVYGRVFALGCPAKQAGYKSKPK